MFINPASRGFRVIPRVLTTKPYVVEMVKVQEEGVFVGSKLTLNFIGDSLLAELDEPNNRINITGSEPTADTHILDTTNPHSVTAVQVGLTDTDDLSEGAVNLYYTETRFDTSFSGKDTDDLSEGTSNLYDQHPAGYIANEHIDWTNTSENLKTTGTGEFSDKVGIGTAPVAGTRLRADYQPVNTVSANAIYVLFRPYITTTGAYYNYAMVFANQFGVAAGKESTGFVMGVYAPCYSSALLVGTQKHAAGINIQYGQVYGTGTVTNSYGLLVSPEHRTGTITNSYDIKINAPNTGGTVTNQWCIYSLHTADSYLAGALGLGSASPDARLEVQTAADEGRQAVTIDQNDEDKAFIDYQGTSAADATKNISTLTGGNSIQGFTKVEINGAEYWMPFYDAPTS